MHWRNKIGEKSKRKIKMQLGLCFIKVSTLTKNKSKRIQHGLSKDIPMTKKWDNWAKLGILMVSECADIFINFVDPVWVKLMNMLKNLLQKENSTEFMNGRNTKIEKDAFVIFLFERR